MKINKLKESEYIKLVPQVDTTPWTVELDDDNEPHFPYTEMQVFTDIRVDVLLCDSDTDDDYIEKIGYADIALINSHIFEETTFMHVDCENGQLSGIMEEMNYHDQRDNYDNLGFDSAYSPFMILRTLHIDKKYRRMGIGKSIIQFAYEYIGALFNLNLNLIAWEVAYYNKTTDGEKFTQADYDANIAFSQAIGGREFSKYQNSRYFLYNSDDRFRDVQDDDHEDELDEDFDRDYLIEKGLLPLSATKKMARDYMKFLKEQNYPLQDYDKS